MLFIVFPGALMIAFNDHVHALDNIAFMIIFESKDALQAKYIRTLFLGNFLDPWEEFIRIQLARTDGNRLHRDVMNRRCMIVVMMLVAVIMIVVMVPMFVVVMIVVAVWSASMIRMS